MISLRHISDQVTLEKSITSLEEILTSNMFLYLFEIAKKRFLFTIYFTI